MPITVDSRVQNWAGYCMTQVATIGADQSLPVFWYDAAGPGRATVYVSVPAYVVQGQASAMTKSRDFLYALLGQIRQYQLPGYAAAQSAWDRFNGQISSYMFVVNDYSNSGAGASWQPPFPQSVVAAWQQVTAAYLAAWMAARTVSRQLLDAANGVNPAVSVPETSLPSPAATTQRPGPAAVWSLPPEAQAQIVGTKVTSGSPALATPTGGASNLPNTAPANVVQTAVPAGQQLVIPRVPVLPTNASSASSPSIFTDPTFLVLLGAGVGLLGLGIYMFRKA